MTRPSVIGSTGKRPKLFGAPPDVSYQTRRTTDDDKAERPQVRLIQVRIYPDTGHGFLWQHHGEFATNVNAFLSA
jgi:hypothetical protein